MSINSSGSYPSYICPGRLDSIPEVDEGNIIPASKTYHNDITLTSDDYQEKSGKPSVRNPNGGLNYVW